MPHDYGIEIDRDDLLRYRKQHGNGEETVVDVTEEVPGEDYSVKVRDPRGNVDLGRFGSKTKAKHKATQWMGQHPKGVTGQNQGVAGMGGGIPGMDGEGIF